MTKASMTPTMNILVRIFFIYTYLTGGPLARAPRVPGNQSILGKAKLSTKILRKPSLNFDNT